VGEEGKEGKEEEGPYILLFTDRESFSFSLAFLGSSYSLLRPGVVKKSFGIEMVIWF
jgi:hypothetical protein